MKITIKAKAKDAENNEEELRKKQQLEELQRIEAEKELAAKEKQKQIDSLLENFEKRAADSPELIKDKDSYFNSKEFNDLSNENFDFNKKRRAELEDRVVHLEDVYEQEKKKSKNTIPWRNYLVYLMILTSLSCCMTFSKYITEVTGNGIGNVANFDFQVEASGLDVGANEVSLAGLISDDKNIVYIVTVQNKSDVSVYASATLSNNTAGATIRDWGNTVAGNLGPNSDPFTFYVEVPPPTAGSETTVTLTVTAEQID